MRSVLRLVLVLAAFVAAGCGGGGSDPSSPAPGADIGAPATSASSTSGGQAMQLTSPSFSEGGTIPDRFTCDGDDVSPQLDVVGVPAEATVLALVMDDPDAPQATWDHWVVFDVPVTESIVEDVGPIGVAGANSWGDVGYGGPCPPSGTHRYVFRVFAFAEPLGLGEGSSKADLLAAAEGNVLAEASLTAFYGR